MSDILKKFENKAISKNPQYGSFLNCQEGLKHALNTSGLPSNRLYLLKDTFMMASRLFVCNLLKLNKGYHLIIDLGALLNFEILKQNNINLDNILYYQPLGEKELFTVIRKMMQCKGLDSIIISNIDLLFPLIFDMKEFISKIHKLEQFCLKYKNPIIVLSPYNKIRYNESFPIVLSFSSIKNSKYTVNIERNMVNFSTHKYNVTINISRS